MIDTTVFLACMILAALILVGVASNELRKTVAYRDVKRRFDAATRAEVLRRCGYRCEHVNLLGMRCREAATQIDHAFPHSKGGPTTLGNAVGLCARHNREKSDMLPSWWYIHRIERNRQRYFPTGADTKIRWN